MIALRFITPLQMKILLLITCILANTAKLTSSSIQRNDVAASFKRDIDIELDHSKILFDNKTFCVFSKTAFEIQISYQPLEMEPRILKIDNCFRTQLTGSKQSTKIEQLDFYVIPISMRKTILFTILILLFAPFMIAFVNQQISMFDTL